MVDVCTPAEMAKRVAGIKKGCEEAIRQGLVKACAIVETQAKKNLTPGSTPYRFAPFDTGLLRGHIGYSIDVTSVDEYTARVGVEASVRNQDGIEIDTYARYVHDGTRPHNAPFEAIQRWAERKSRGGHRSHGSPFGSRLPKKEPNRNHSSLTPLSQHRGSTCRSSKMSTEKP